MFIGIVVRYISKQCYAETSRKGKGRKWGKGNTFGLWTFKGLITTRHYGQRVLPLHSEVGPSSRAMFPKGSQFSVISLLRELVICLHSSILIYALLLPFHRSGPYHLTITIPTFGKSKYCNFFLCPLKTEYQPVFETSGVRWKVRKHQNLPSPLLTKQTSGFSLTCSTLKPPSPTQMEVHIQTPYLKRLKVCSPLVEMVVGMRALGCYSSLCSGSIIAP